MLDAVTRNPGEARLLLDFDGTLSDIVATPAEARPGEGAAAVLSALALVAVISGRRAREVAAVLGAPAEIQLLGLYGLEDRAGSARASRSRPRLTW